MKRKINIFELYGPGGNFYSGHDLGGLGRGSLGTRGADSNFSRRMQATFPVDYFEDEEEDDDLDDSILEAALNQSLSPLFEDDEKDKDKKEDEEDLDEFSAVGAIGGGPTLPLGRNSKNEKATWPQIYKNWRYAKKTFGGK